MEIKTASDLKYMVRISGNSRYFFDRKSMKFFGDTMKNYGVRKARINAYGENGEIITVEAWELYRRQPVKGGLQSSAYFDPQTFKRIHPHY